MNHCFGTLRCHSPSHSSFCIGSHAEQSKGLRRLATATKLIQRSVGAGQRITERNLDKTSKWYLFTVKLSRQPRDEEDVSSGGHRHKD